MPALLARYGSKSVRRIGGNTDSGCILVVCPVARIDAGQSKTRRRLRRAASASTRRVGLEAASSLAASSRIGHESKEKRSASFGGRGDALSMSDLAVFEGSSKSRRAQRSAKI